MSKIPPSVRKTIDKQGYYARELNLNAYGTIDQYKTHFFNRIYKHVKNNIGESRPMLKYIRTPDGPEREELKRQITEKFAAKCIAPESMQLIPYDQWGDPTCFDGPTLMHVYHPHWRLAWDRLLANYKSNSDTLLVLFCGGSKPYSSNNLFKLYCNAAKTGIFDFMIASLYPCPVYPFDASLLYPYVVSDWPHTSSPRLTDLYREIHAQYMAEFLRVANYKKVIYCLGDSEERQGTVNLVRKYKPEETTLIDLCSDRDLIAVVKEQFPLFRSNPGIMEIRLPLLKLTREYIANEFDEPSVVRRALKLSDESQYQQF